MRTQRLLERLDDTSRRTRCLRATLTQEFGGADTPVVNEPKKHHYVPRSVLRNFSIGGGQRSIFVFDKSSGRSFASPIADTAAERNFYRVDVGERYINFEPLFQDLDDRLASLVAKLTTESVIGSIDPCRV